MKADSSLVVSEPHRDVLQAHFSVQGGLNVDTVVQPADHHPARSPIPPPQSHRRWTAARSARSVIVELSSRLSWRMICRRVVWASWSYRRPSRKWQAVRVRATEHPRRRAQGVRALRRTVYRPLPVRFGLSAQDLPPTQQGRILAPDPSTAAPAHHRPTTPYATVAPTAHRLAASWRSPRCPRPGRSPAQPATATAP